MIKALFVLLFSLSAFSSIRVELEFSTPEVGQGELIQTRLQIENTDGLELQKLKGQTLGKTVYFYNISPLIKREGSGFYEADASVIFIKVPDNSQVQDEVAGQQILINWGAIKVNPTEASPQLIFGTFEVPKKIRWVLWVILSILCFIFVGLISWILSKSIKRKREEKQRKLNLKNEVLGCRNYEEVVAFWKRKHLLINEFPHIQEPFQKLEEVLNRYQFRPRQSEAEKIEVVESYRKFVRSVEGGFSGI